MSDPTMGSTSAATAEKISFEGFLTQYDGQFAEWVDGEVIVMSPVSDKHDGIVFFVRCLLQSYLSFRPLGVVRGEPFTMKIGTGRGREPDILFVATAHRDRLNTNFLNGPADVVIEVVSPESVTRDHVTKYNEYQAAGVPEYWVLDPTVPKALFYRLNHNKRYELIAQDETGHFHSQSVPGFRLHIPTLWADTLPDIVQAVEIARQMATKR